MLILRQKTLDQKIADAIARIPKPEPGPDWTPELGALREEVTRLNTELDEMRATATARHTEVLANLPGPVVLPEPIVLPEPVDLTPLYDRTDRLDLALISLGVKIVDTANAVRQTDDTVAYLLESPRETQVIREIEGTGVLQAYRGWVRPMGQ